MAHQWRRGQPGREWLDGVARALARLALRVFFRDVEIHGLDNVPERGPVLFVANHGNGLVDPVALVGLLPRMPRFLAKHTLWSNLAVRPLLALGGAVPVFRAGEGDTSRNQETFSRCYDELEAGGSVAIFPEGISHDEPSLQPLRTGAARIVLGAAERNREPVAIVPVGLTFDAKARFRSRLLVAVGKPLESETAAGDDDAEIVQRLTEQIDDALREVTLNVASWDAARLVERAADLIDGDTTRLMPGRSPLGERFSLRRALGARYEEDRARRSAEMERLESMALRYEGMLEALRLRDDHVTAQYPWRHALGYVGYRLPILLLLLPFAAVGALLNYLPYRIPGWVASRVEHQPDQPATYKLILGLFLFPLTWAVEIGVAGLWGGASAALAMAVASPATGWIALRFAERNQSFWSELRAYLTLRLFPERAAALRALRAEMRGLIRELVEETESAPDPPQA